MRRKGSLRACGGSPLRNPGLGAAMEVGSCFKNYTDFSEHFAAYKKESRLQFGLKSCVSVRFHNRQNGTNIREDITFMRVKFACVRPREHGKKKKPQEEEEEEPQLCPAYLVLQYSEELDRLVITEQNGNHIHAEPKAPSISSDRSPLARLAARMAASRACGIPPAKLRKEEPAEVEACNMETSLSVKVEEDREASMNVETDAEKHPPPSLSPSKEPEAPRADEDNRASSSLVHINEVMRDFLRVDAGSLASFSMGSTGKELERLSFQTSKMKGLFLRFPESLLLHRVLGCGGHTLYAFLVESKDRVAKLVHFAILKDDTPESMREMLSVFKKFNSEEGQKVKVVLVDVAFLHREVLRELFPSAQVLLSVYHTVRLLERKLKKSHYPSKQALRMALRKAVFSPSKASLEALSPMVKDLVDPGLYEHLQAHWFSCEMLWYFHAKKGLHACSTYIDSLEVITQKLSSLFSPKLSLETSILRFVASVNDFNAKGLENPSQSDGRSILMKELKIKPPPPLKRRPRAATEPTKRFLAKAATKLPKRFPAKTVPESPKHFPAKAETEPLNQSVRHSPAKPVATMLAALRETCTDLAYQLCLNEWDMVQKSTQLVTLSTRRKATVQLLEDTHQVSKGSQRCSCFFSCRYQLPCRHILAVLLANQQVVEEAMVAKRWQRKYQHLPALRENMPEAPGAPKGSLPAAPAPKERQDMIQSLSKELGNLLLQSEGEELEERSATLRMIVNIWTKCSELREEEGAAVKPLNVRNVGDLPFLWVKKEEMEEVAISSVTHGATLGTNQTSVA
ncbi:zinc finger SWIM domain-containing protein 3 isoform X1 [Anolis carolinensis]|uniref:zinc finger SWIM domain-containing protein 3 isoform X1 n=2 Tax=Anolis carolinensis TaxID=28377 RepID=UPI002F2B343F